MVNRNPGRRRDLPDELDLSFAEAERGRADGGEAEAAGPQPRERRLTEPQAEHDFH